MRRKSLGHVRAWIVALAVATVCAGCALRAPRLVETTADDVAIAIADAPRLWVQVNRRGDVSRVRAADGAGEWHDVLRPERPAPLWRLEWEGPDGALKTLTTRKARLEGMRGRPHDRTLTWHTALEQARDTTIQARVVTGRDDFSHWRLVVETQAAGWKLRGAQYPVLAGLPLPATEEAFPASPRMLSLRSGNAVLFLGADDPGERAATEHIAGATREGGLIRVVYNLDGLEIVDRWRSSCEVSLSASLLE